MSEHKRTNRLIDETSPCLLQHAHSSDASFSMKSAVVPRLSGVYQIRCNPTGKIYIGSTVDLRMRRDQHRKSLRRGCHKNPYLQQAWDKYGEENFDFIVLEFADTFDLLITEQKWIDKTGCADRKIGFNIYPVAGSPGDMFAQVWEGFVDPSGVEIRVKNLQEFCRQNSLDFPSMLRLAKGKSKLKSHKGWTHRNSVRQREYVKTYDRFLDPDGRPVGLITNLAAFCRKHDLDNTHMVAVAHGRICSHHGWTHIGGKQKPEPKAYTGYIDPDGKRVTISNLKAFCLRHGLHPVHMHALKSGRRKSHKGWTWRKTDE